MIEWRFVIDFPDYKVSDSGIVASLKKHTLRPLKPEVGKFGHQRVCLCKDGKVYKRLVHHIVLEAFVGPCPEGLEACHFPDRNPANNHVTNLRWDSHANNGKDMVKHGTGLD